MAGCLQAIGERILIQRVWPFLETHVDYWWCFNTNIQGLNTGIEKLKQQNSYIERESEGVRHGTHILCPGVEEWLKGSTNKIEEAAKIISSHPEAWNLITRYSLGKNAKKTAQEIENLLKKNVYPIAVPALPRAIASSPTLEFESRKGIENGIIDSLKDSSVYMIGICGMGGVGKTTMARRIWKRVMEEHIFDEVVMFTVSRNDGIPKIQSEIAELFKLEFDEKHEKNPSTRADKLRSRLMDPKRKLIILDNVWDSLGSKDLENLGIPIQSDFRTSKVLFTSRYDKACTEIRNRKVFKLKILEEDEAWLLFTDKAGGDCGEGSKVARNIARDIAAKCKGLPIALVTVGCYLQGGPNIYQWEHLLSELRKSYPEEHKDVVEKVYDPLKLSYYLLDNERVRSLFLLCCLFPEDFNISVEQLTWYSMGLGLFDGINNIKEARNRTHTLVGNLESHFLLIDVEKKGKKGWKVKMHDVLRDVAIYIGSIEKHGFLKSLTSIENPSHVDCNWMSVDISNEQMEVPGLSLFPMRFPKLRLLMLSSSNDFYDISHISFEGVEDLNVLSFQNISIRSLPQTLGLLKKLQTLCLFHCPVENISGIGELKSLKILSCSGCANIKELPAEIRRLKCLRLLELNGCKSLQSIPFGIISSLSQLEELKIGRSFSKWGERGNASLKELEDLRNLTCLEIEISDCNLSAQKISFSQELSRYRIWIATEVLNYFDFRDYDKAIYLNLTGAVGNWIQLLARNAECLRLRGNGSDNINLAEMENLRNLQFINCSTVKKLVDTSYQIQNVSLCNLKSIYIGWCSNLDHLFSVSVARTRLGELESLHIENCQSMEQVFWNEIKDNNRDVCIEFPKLKELTLRDLPNLTAFCQGLENIKFPNLTSMEIGGLRKLNSLSPLNSETVAGHDQNTCFHFVCNPKVEMSLLKNLTLSAFEYNIKNIWCHQIPNNVFNNLVRLEINYMNGIRSLMSTSIAKKLVSLKYLYINECEDMVEVIEIDDDNDEQVVDMFPNLSLLSLYRLHKLIRFWQWNHTLELPLLETLNIYNCLAMKTFTLESVNTPNIREISVNNKKIKNVKDLNDVLSHMGTKSQDTFKTEEDWIEEDGDEDEDEDWTKDGDENEDEDWTGEDGDEDANKDENNDERKEYDNVNVNVNKDEDDNERK